MKQKFLLRLAVLFVSVLLFCSCGTELTLDDDVSGAETEQEQTEEETEAAGAEEETEAEAAQEEPDCYAPGDQEEPDVWLALGQSNMKTRLPQETLDGLVESDVEVMQDDLESLDYIIEDWTPLEEVVNFSHVGGVFGITLAGLLEKKIRVFAAAADGTTISCWQEWGSCYAAYIAPLVDSGLSIKGVIWWQGESDALNSNEAYELELERFFNTLRDKFNNQELRIVIVGLQKYCANWEYFDTPEPTCSESESWRNIQTAQRHVADEDPYVEMTDASFFTNGELHPKYAYTSIAENLAESALGLAYEECE